MYFVYCRNTQQRTTIGDEDCEGENYCTNVSSDLRSIHSSLKRVDKYRYNFRYKAGTVAKWVRASVLSHFEWMVLSSNHGGGRIIYLFIKKD